MYENSPTGGRSSSPIPGNRSLIAGAGFQMTLIALKRRADIGHLPGAGQFDLVCRFAGGGSKILVQS